MMLIFWLACQNAQKNDDSAVATEATPATPDFPLSQCGLREYNLLPTDTMGTIVSSERRDEFSFSKEALQALYNSFDFPLPQPETGVETHFIQYTTQDKGEEVLATGLVVIPTDIEEEMLTVLWEHFTLGLNDTCAPTAIGIAGVAHPVLFASLGNVVVAPDYIGMSGWRGESDTLHPYIVAEPTAIASLDSLRALHRFVEDEAPDIRIRKDHMVIWGASEGGFASLFTDRYLPHYAPEFESKATVAAIPPTDVMWLAKYGTENLGETTLGILGSITSMSQWYETEEPLSDILQPAIADIIVDELKNKCEGFEFIETIQSVEDIFLPGFIADVQNENDSSNWICAIKESGIITTSVPRVRDTPLLIVTGEDDPLLLPDPVREDIPRLCEQGYRVEYRECAGENHTGGAIRSLGEQWEWIEARVAGTPMDNVCVVQAPHDCANE